MEKNYTYCHEHLYIDLSHIKNDSDTILNEKNKLIDEMKYLVTKGVKNLVEVTNRGMGRDINFLIDIEKQSGINILASTGYYINPFFPQEVYEKNEKELAKILIDEINVGIDGSIKKAQVIGEIGTSFNDFTPLEKKVFLASSIAHKETGKVLSTHTSLSTMALEQVDFFEKEEIDLNFVTIGHCDLKDNLDTILRIIDKGVHVQFDTIGKNSYYSDSSRVKMLLELQKRGLLHRIMLSMDITRKSHLKANGGLGFSYLIDEFVPLLMENGINQKEIDLMLEHNPNKFFIGGK